MQAKSTTTDAPARYEISYDAPTRDFRLDWQDATPSTWHKTYLDAEEAAREQMSHTRRAYENLDARIAAGREMKRRHAELHGQTPESNVNWGS